LNRSLDVGLQKKQDVYNKNNRENLAELTRIWKLKKEGKIKGRKK